MLPSHPSKSTWRARWAIRTRGVLFPSPRSGGRAREHERLTAIVTAAADGGRSGRLHEQFRVLPPGDIRNCLHINHDASKFAVEGLALEAVR